jgi:hypothetical protein
MQWCPCGLRVRGGRSVGECVAQRVTVSWALVCVNGFRLLWVRPDVLRLNAFGRGGTGVACYRGEGPHQFGDVGDADQQYRVGGAKE